MTRRRLIWIGAGLVVASALLFWMFRNACAMPVVRQTTVELPYPANVEHRAVRVALITDSHLSGPDGTPERLDRIVNQVNALRPDLILLGGDYLGDSKPFGRRTPFGEALKPFARLRAPMGVIAVLGNHDVFRATHRPPEELRRAFRPAGIALLVNRATRRGPLVIGGVDDYYKGRINVPYTVAQMRRRGGVPILLSHSADIFPMLDAATPLLLAGHSHCGQIALPYFGAIWVPADTGTRYACGRYDEAGRTLVVSGGVGTSGLPLRLFAPPDIWIVTVRPKH